MTTTIKDQIRFTEKMRRHVPKVGYDKDKNPTIVCPFCRDPHVLIPGQAAVCGTTIEIMAVQPTYRSSRIACARCGETGGTLTKLGNNQYVHAHHCSPKKFYEDTPKTSWTAALAWKLLPKENPNWLARFLVNGVKWIPEELVKLDSEGKPTDSVVGYRWRKAT